MPLNKFSTPRHMSRSALPIMYVNYLRSNWSDFFGIAFLLYISIGELSLIQKILYPTAIILLYLILIAFLIFLRYYFFRFHISEGHLIVRKGIFRKETLSIPTSKIHSLRTKSGFFYRLFDMKGVSADTLADKNKEVELILDDTDWNELLEMFSYVECPMKPEAVYDKGVNTEQSIDNSIKFPNTALLKGAMCQNHLKGTIIMAIVVFNILLQLDYDIISTAAIYAVEKGGEIHLTMTKTVISLVILYIVSLLFWLGKVVLRYFNMRLDVSARKLFFESGLITRRSVRFAHDKLSTIKVKVNPMEHLMHISTVSMIQAFNVTDEEEKSDVLVYGCTFTEKFLTWWFGNDYKQSAEIMSLHSGKGVFWYSIRYKLMAIIAASVALTHFEQYIYTAMLGILLIVYIIEGFMKTHRSCIVLKNNRIEVNDGSFAKITYYIKYSDIESVELRSTPFTPYTHRMHLIFSTNGTYLKIRSLKDEEARMAYEIILAKLYNEDIRKSL